MEFFFLIQRVWPEVLILLGLIGMIIYFSWKHHFGSIANIRSVFEKKPRKSLTNLEPTPVATTPVAEGIQADIATPLDMPITTEMLAEAEAHPTDTGSQDEGVSEVVSAPADTEKTHTSKKQKPHKEKTEEKMHIMDSEETEKLLSLVSGSRTLVARGMFTEARTLIVEGLSMDKHHRELNLLLGQIYEQDGHYEKAEYVYKDIAHDHPNDTEILERLGNVLIIEKKYPIASEIYKKILSLSGETENTLYMLTHISNTLADQEETLRFAKKYQLHWPKNPEILAILGEVQVALGKRRDAIETYKTLKNITPYNHEIAEMVQKLLIEEELAGNFTEK